MTGWLMRNFPSGEWSLGWFSLVVLVGLLTVGICAALNLHEGKTWRGKPR